jgi:prephenate dehydratase
MTASVSSQATIAFLGPAGTFTEAALRREPDLAAATLIPLESFVQILAAVSDGRVDYGFVAIENSIEGTVNVALDQLVFERELLIVREVVIPITQSLLAPAGTKLGEIERVVSFPHATAQCRGWLGLNLPDVVEVAATSTAEAARQVATEAAAGVSPGTAAIGTTLAAALYGLDVLVDDIADNADNVTRFVLVGRPEVGIPAPSGHDKTSIVCFQADDRPGSLHRILGQFSARDINLVKLESRPTKQSLGDYCFIIDFEGHVAEEMIADCLRDLHTGLRELKFLGSYPAAGAAGADRRRDASAAWRAADAWIDVIRASIKPSTSPP